MSDDFAGMTDIARVRADVRSRLATQIQRLRVLRGWSVAELAQHAERDPALVAALEVGQGEITLDDLFMIAEALGVDVYDLVVWPVAH